MGLTGSTSIPHTTLSVGIVSPFFTRSEYHNPVVSTRRRSEFHNPVVVSTRRNGRTSAFCTNTCSQARRTDLCSDDSIQVGSDSSGRFILLVVRLGLLTEEGKKAHL